MRLTLNAPAARLRDCLRVAEKFADEYPHESRGSGIGRAVVYSYRHDGHAFVAHWTKGGALVVQHEGSQP